MFVLFEKSHRNGGTKVRYLEGGPFGPVLKKKIWPWTNIKFQKKANAVWRKTNGQTFRKTAKCSLEKTDKHFEKQTNVV